MPRILLKERGAFGNADTGGAWLSSARATAGDKPEEGEDDVKSSCPLCPGRHTCYKWPGQRVAIPRGLQLACMKPESLVIAGQPYGGEFVPGLVHTARHTMGAGHARSRYLNRKEGMPKAGLVTGVKS
ncbi:hypothetical protein H6P81_021617 [Aristolochia fimbriata]|uniref:Uncharacterized protein n=1 Tax=Aristolochia fimbriata TaxID=158543 RepID=A0AAV7DT72_ARIFI|nr:hypothetical protein H6P81_021617 [Aristolochia fimbriata]